jgi:hypothetical protein
MERPPALLAGRYALPRFDHAGTCDARQVRHPARATPGRREPGRALVTTFEECLRGAPITVRRS